MAAPAFARRITRAKNLIHTGWLQSFETYHQQASTVGLYALDISWSDCSSTFRV